MAAGSETTTLLTARTGAKAKELASGAKKLGRDISGLLSEDVANEHATGFAEWRDCRLRAAVVPLALGIVMQLYALLGYRYNLGDTIAAKFGEEYAEHFSVLVQLNRLEAVLDFLFAFGSWVALVMSVGTGTWLSRGSEKHASVKRVRWSVFLGFAGYFLMMLFIPYTSGIDTVGLRKMACLDFVREVRSRGRQHMVGDVIDRIYTMHGIEIHDDICDCVGDNDWETAVLTALNSSGVFFQNATCPSRAPGLEGLAAVGFDAAMEPSIAADAAKDVAGCSVSCSSNSRVCSTECTPMFVPLGMLVILNGPATLLKNDFEALGKLSGVCKSCMRDILGCMVRCSGIKEMLGKPKVCLSHSEIDNLKMALHAGSMVNLVGIVYGIRAVVLLLPFASSVFHGVTIGSRNAGTVLPSSGLPVFLGLASSFCGIPLALIFFIFINTLVGNILLELGIVCYVVDRVLKTQFWLTTPISQRKEAIVSDWRLHAVVSWLTVLLMGGGLFMVGWHLSSGRMMQILVQNISLYHFDKLQALFASFFTSLYMSYLGRMIFNYFGSSLLFSVFFADTFVSLTYSFHKKNALMAKDSRTELWRDMENLRMIIDDDDGVLPQLRQEIVSPHDYQEASPASGSASDRSFFFCCSRDTPKSEMTS
eukprot:TRINITY_DN23294_c0_g3_i1.p1 TRINITY_DN23294_c0_g3~~TRINITY_DN23294_c0_g3_i1.p1  ORF type:complete len:649 (-),score=137.31 TRINITY_DN23294_c0_g3_i1:215-2161(-)